MLLGIRVKVKIHRFCPKKLYGSKGAPAVAASTEPEWAE